METNRCSVTGFSTSYAYKKGCRCFDCRMTKKRYTRNDINAAARAKAWAQKNPEKVKQRQNRINRKHKLKTLYGMSIEEYIALKEKQNDCCAICGEKDIGMSNSKSYLSVDHDHTTNRVRGLLCGNCNVGLGHFKDDVKILNKAIHYIETNGDIQ